MEILKAIKKTIAYSQKYGGRLNEEQLFERLIGKKIYSKEEVGKNLNPSVLQTSPFDKRETFAKEKIKKAEELAKLIEKKFKNILFLGLTGSVAAGYPKQNDDIDLLIITKTNKLWINRLKLRWFIIMNKIPHRRFGKKERRDEFCFNLWLDEKSLIIEKERQNLRNAVDLILMEPLVNKKNTYEKFIRINDWVKEYVATGYNMKIRDLRFMKYDLRIKQSLLDIIVNWLVFWPQLGYMKKRIKKEKVGLHEAFFHH